MLNIKIICIGKMKEKSLKDIINEFLKRLSKYSKTEIIELEDEKIPINSSNAECEKIKEMESIRIIEKINRINNSYMIALDLNGKEYTSQKFATKISDIQTYNSSTLIFVIGGSLGLSDKIKEMANEKVCFSKMTFPHQLIRVFLLEQIFRSFKILNNEIYHH